MNYFKTRNDAKTPASKIVSAAPPCGFCSSPCRTVVTGLFDDRFGSPGLFDIVSCRCCGLMQTWPRPSESELKELYERYYNWGGEQDTGYNRARETFLSSALYRLWLRWDGDVSFHLRRGPGRLLDVGCNEGRGLSMYRRNGFEAEGLEVNEVAATAARKQGFTVHTQPLAQFTPVSSYNVVVMANVLEHVPDPAAALRQIHNLLAPGGEVWISCPNAKSYWRKVFGRYWINWHVPFHLWHFSPETLKGLLSKAHFRRVEVHTRSPAQWIAQSFLARLGSRPGRANRLLRSVPLVAGLMLALKATPPSFFKGQDSEKRGDCLVVAAAT